MESTLNDRDGNPASLAELDPREAARRLVAEHSHERRWLDAFAEHLDRQRPGMSLARTLDVWGLSQAQAAELFGVTRQALGKWLRRGVPAERAAVVADLAAATDLLIHYLKRDRIQAVVRRRVDRLQGRSLLDMVAAGDTRAMLRACREMFAFGLAQQQ